MYTCCSTYAITSEEISVFIRSLKVPKISLRKSFFTVTSTSKNLVMIKMTGVLSLFGQNRLKWHFFVKFEVKIFQRVNPVQKRSRYEKSFKVSILSENVAKKGFSHPERTQNYKWQIANFEILRFVISGFGCVLGVQSPFWHRFRKVWRI